METVTSREQGNEEERKHRWSERRRREMKMMCSKRGISRVDEKQTDWKEKILSEIVGLIRRNEERKTGNAKNRGSNKGWVCE